METIEQHKQRLIKLRPYVLTTYILCLSFWLAAIISIIFFNDYRVLIVAMIHHFLFYKETTNSIKEYNEVVKGYR